MRWLRRQDEFKKTQDVLVYALRALGVSALLFTALIVADTADHGRFWWELAAVVVLTLAIVRLLWVLWLLGELLKLAVVDDESIPLPNPPFMDSTKIPNE